MRLVAFRKRLGFSYIERENLLCNSDGNMDHYYDVVYRLENGRLVQAAAGYYGAEDNSAVRYDENQEPVYQYQWNGAVMTREEYNKALNAVLIHPGPRADIRGTSGFPGKK